MGKDEWYLPILHSVGSPLENNQKDVSWPCNPEKDCIALFTDDQYVMSFGSSFGANALASHRIYALR